MAKGWYRFPQWHHSAHYCSSNYNFENHILVKFGTAYAHLCYFKKGIERTIIFWKLSQCCCKTSSSSLTSSSYFMMLIWRGKKGPTIWSQRTYDFFVRIFCIMWGLTLLPYLQCCWLIWPFKKNVDLSEKQLL